MVSWSVGRLLGPGAFSMCFLALRFVEEAVADSGTWSAGRADRRRLGGVSSVRKDLMDF